jgi:hypothetical protein
MRDHDPYDDDIIGPEPEDYAISYGRGGYGVSQIEGKFLGSFRDRDDAEDFIAEQMQTDQFFPNVWFIDDHGGANQLYLTEAHERVRNAQHNRENPTHDVLLGQQILRDRNPRVSAAFDRGRSQRWEFVFKGGYTARGYIGRTTGWAPEYLLMHRRHGTGSGDFLRDRDLKDLYPIADAKSRRR